METYYQETKHHNDQSSRIMPSLSLRQPQIQNLEQIKVGTQFWQWHSGGEAQDSHSGG